MGEAKTVAGHVKRYLTELGLLDAKKVAVKICDGLDENDDPLERCPLCDFDSGWRTCRHPDMEEGERQMGPRMREDQRIWEVPDRCPLRKQSFVVSLHPDAK